MTFYEFIDATLLFYINMYNKVLQSIKKQLLLFCTICLLGVLLCVAMFFSIKKTHIVTYTFTYNILHKKVYGDWINELHQLCTQHNTKALAKKLNIDENTSGKIVDIVAVNVANSPLQDDLTEAIVPFYVIVNFKESSIIDSFENKIFNYLNNNKSAQLSINSKLEQNTKRLEFYKHELQLLDSLKLNYKLGGANENNNDFKNSMELSEKYNNIIIDLQQVIKTNTAVNLFNTSVPINSQSFQLIKKKLIAIILFTVLLAIGIVVFIEFKKRPIS